VHSITNDDPETRSAIREEKQKYCWSEPANILAGGCAVLPAHIYKRRKDLKEKK
jgi:hypothetical protein